MRSSHYLVTASVLAVATALSAGQAAAQTSGANSPTVVEEIVVTGSFIAGTPEDAALPVNVIGNDELQKQGSPSTVDLMKSIPAMQGVVGESNQFGAGQTTGTSSANLRGLGAERTLVLFNGRRMATSPGSIYVDTNLIPSAAVGRVEVLKDGAAATYGSDAIGGVVNFITRKNFDGLEVQAGYSAIDGSDGEYNTSVAYGHTGDRSSMLLTAGYRHRSPLSTTERDFAIRSYAENPQGGWSSFGNPGLFLSSSNGGVTYTSPVTDPACNVISGPQTGGTLCQFQYVGFNNLIEEEDQWQLYGEFNFDIDDTTTFHVEALYAGHDVSTEASSPSYPPNNFPSSALTTKIQGNGFFVPAANPGLQALLGTNPGQIPASAATAGLFTSVAWRPIGVDGNDLFEGLGKEDKRRFDAYRISASLKGEFEFGGGIGWDASMTYMDDTSDVATPDILVGRLQQALKGLGGFNCSGTTPGANGCLWFNPFSSGIDANAVDGRTNPNYVASTKNSREVLDYIFDEYAYSIRSQLYTADLVFNGRLPIDFGGGEIGWAAGAQYRWSGLERQNSDFTNVAVSPCPDSSINPAATCAAQNGPFSFFGALSDYDLDQSVVSAFGELSVPITNDITATLAVRHEDYGGNVGSTTNPKVALRWQASDWLAFRASAGTTFRAPPITQITSSSTTSLAYTTAAGGYRAYDTFGNPNLEPEEAVTLNLGALFDFGDFRASIDYWAFDFEGPIDNESGSDIVNTIFPNGAAGANNCANPEFAALLSRITFTGACGASAINRVRINFVNGPDVKTSGLDFSATYRARDVLGGDMNFGADLTYVLEYAVDANVIEGIEVAPATDYVGTMDYLGYGSQPQWRGSFYTEYTRDIHNVRATIRYIDNMVDTRAGSATFSNGPDGQKIDAFVTTDLAYRVFLPWDTTVSASVINVFDQDPPFARLDLSYDPFTANPLGRYYKLNVTKRF